MPVDILSVQGFAFFIVVMATGYSYVEIFLGEHYPLRPAMTRYGNGLFDRLMHYVLAGVVVNVLYSVLFVAVGAWRGLLGNLNTTGQIAEALMGGPGPAADSIQFVVFSIAYFGLVTWAPTAVLGTLWTWRKLNLVAFSMASSLHAPAPAAKDPEPAPAQVSAKNSAEFELA